MIKEITLKTPSMEGKIYVGEEVLDTYLPSLTSGQKNFVLTDSNVSRLYPELFAKYFKDTEIFVLPAGEEYKTFTSLQQILERMASAGLHRTSKLFAVGGGVIGDIGGLAAALYMRGIACVQIPTTLLAQVDSSVGGKTAVDLGGVKNIIGAFYQPQAVLVKPSFLQTLPLREVKCGVGEIVKYAALSGDIFDKLQANMDKWNNLAFLTELIADCIQHKVNVVQADEKECGERKSLNVGHTTGHAIELSSKLSHGECVLYGMLLETKMAINAGVCDKAYGLQLLEIIRNGLAMQPTSAPDFSNIGEDSEKAKSDKKNTGDGEIVMSVAKRKNEWTILKMPFEQYKQSLCEAVREKR